MSIHAEAVLRAGLAELHLSLSDAQVQGLLDYQNLIRKWNKVYNLTSVRDPEQMLDQHLMDCLAAIPELLHEFPAACDVLDVGEDCGGDGGMEGWGDDGVAGKNKKTMKRGSALTARLSSAARSAAAAALVSFARCEAEIIARVTPSFVLMSSMSVPSCRGRCVW